MGHAVNEMVTGRPTARLRPFIGDYVGYRVEGLGPGVHAGLPSRSLTFIVALDEPLDVSSHSNDRDRYWAMLAGLHGAPATVRHDGAMHGVQLSLTPLGALALFGTPSAALASIQVHLDDVMPSAARELVERLALAPTWPARWAVLDDVLGRSIDATAEIAAPLSAAWAMLSGADGNVRVGDLADRVGWSRRTLGHRFRAEFGLSPKLAARVMRFERAQRLLRSPPLPDLASVAASCGYADQAHMTRDWNEFAGASPAAWLASEDVPILQDDDRFVTQS